MNNIGAMYATGSGVKPDDEEALRWFQKAAAKGNAAAMGWIGKFFAEGRGVARDQQKAKEWFAKAAEKGDAGAKRWLEENKGK